jgi:hypothetical protein
MDVYQIGRMARQCGQSRESFENYRQEALKLCNLCGDTFIECYERALARCC